MRSQRQNNLLNFITIQHGEQKRKYTGEPYTVHLVAVAECAEANNLELGYEIGLCHDLFKIPLALTNNYEPHCMNMAMDNLK